MNKTDFIEKKISDIKKEVKGGIAVAAVSGGVDSVTTAVLGFNALKNNLKVVFLNNGLMREREAEKVSKMMKNIGIPIKVYKVEKEFFKALANIADPEEKRRAFRETFYQTLAQIAKSLQAKYLLQGTIAADVLETRKGVKTQHNVLGQIGINPMEKYGFKVIEPLKELYKPEVREIAKKLRLPSEVNSRKPFPGPGLSVRVIGEVTPKRVEIVRKATEIVEEETKRIDCFQAFAVLMTDKATGINTKGRRKYGNIIVIRVVNSKDAIKAKPSSITLSKLKRIMDRITDEIPSIVRVLYDVTEKPPATIEFE